MMSLPHHWFSIQPHFLPCFQARTNCVGTTPWVQCRSTPAMCAAVHEVRAGLELWAWNLHLCKPDNRISGQPDVDTSRCQPKLLIFIQKCSVKAVSQNTSCNQGMRHLLRWSSGFDNGLRTELLVSAPFIMFAVLAWGWDCTGLPGSCRTRMTGTRYLPCLKQKIMMVLRKGSSQNQPMHGLRGAKRRMTVITPHCWLHLSQ